MHNYTQLRFVHSNKRHKRSEYKLGNTGVYEIHMTCLYSKFNVQSLCMCVRWNVGSSLSLAAELDELQLGSHKVL